MTQENPNEFIQQALLLEREAHDLRANQKIEPAFEAYDRAGNLYRECGEHLKAAFCFASAATCWNIRTGWQPLHNAATRNDMAAKQAMLAKNYDYARSLFREAALLYEKEGDIENYSSCYYESQRADAKRAWALFASGNTSPQALEIEIKGTQRLRALFTWLANTMNSFVWGYGEKPSRTLGMAATIILVSALLYDISGKILVHGHQQPIYFFEALYFSLTTFTTVGFGDYLPLGWVRGVAVSEAMSGIVLMPLFLVGLTRRYLRLGN